MRGLIAILLLIPSLAFGAITERYVTDAGAGTGDGSSEANAMSFARFTDYMSTGGSFTAAAGDRFNIKGAITGRTTTTDTWVNGGTITSPVIIRGYNSTIGDLTSLARTNGNGALVTTNYPTISYTTGGINVTGSFIIIEALQISGANATSGSGVLVLSGTDIFVKRCYVFNSSTSVNANAIVTANTGSATREAIIDCDISLTGASGGNSAITMLAVAGGVNRIIGCRVKGGPALGINMGGTTNFCVSNTVYSSGGIGIRDAAVGSSVIMYNTVVGGSSDGINVVTGNATVQILIGNMTTDNTGAGVNMVSTANGAFASNTRLRDNGSTYGTAGDWLTATKYDDVTSGAGTSDYIGGSGSSGDYRLLPTSPGVAKGNPLFAAIGALQNATPTATPSSTPTPTATATASFTPCAPTPTATATFTPTPTATSTSTPTPSATATASYTPCAICSGISRARADNPQ